MEGDKAHVDEDILDDGDEDVLKTNVYLKMKTKRIAMKVTISSMKSSSSSIHVVVSLKVSAQLFHKGLAVSACL